MANILLVFVLLTKINYNPDLITWIILLPMIWQTTKLAFCRKLRSWKSAIYIYKNNRLDCTNTELLNKFEEIKTENVFNNDLKKLFNTENYEEEINDDVYLSFKRNLHFDNKKGRYEIRLPFKDYSEILPDNNNLA